MGGGDLALGVADHRGRLDPEGAPQAPPARPSPRRARAGRRRPARASARPALPRRTSSTRPVEVRASAASHASMLSANTGEESQQLERAIPSHWPPWPGKTKATLRSRAGEPLDHARRAALPAASARKPRDQLSRSAASTDGAVRELGAAERQRRRDRSSSSSGRRSSWERRRRRLRAQRRARCEPETRKGTDGASPGRPRRRLAVAGRGLGRRAPPPGSGARSCR